MTVSIGLKESFYCMNLHEVANYNMNEEKKQAWRVRSVTGSIILRINVHEPHRKENFIVLR